MQKFTDISDWAEQALIYSLLFQKNIEDIKFTLDKISFLQSNEFTNKQLAKLLTIIRENTKNNILTDIVAINQISPELTLIASSLITGDNFYSIMPETHARTIHKSFLERKFREQVILLENLTANEGNIEDISKTIKGLEEKLSELQSKESVLDHTLIRASDVFDRKIEVQESEILGLKVQYGAVWGLTGTTSVGKTELSLDILNNHADEKTGRVSLLVEFEGTEKELIYRMQKKGIKNPNLYCLISPDFSTIEAFIKRFQDEKVLIIIDYLQVFARRLLGKDTRQKDTRFYVNDIYQQVDTFRKKYPQVSVCLIMSMSKDGIREASLSLEEGKTDKVRSSFLNAIKESGDVQYDLDYCYALTYADNYLDNKIFLSRFNSLGQSRECLKILTIKSDRIGMKAENVTLWYKQDKNGISYFSNNNLNSESPL